MRTGAPLCLLLLGLLAACGEETPPARYEVFTLELIDLPEGTRVVPGTELHYRVHYVGDLARDLRFTAVLTHEATGETASLDWSELIQDSARVDLRKFWRMRHEFLKRSGRIRVQLQASLTATLEGSKPWVVQSQSVYVELYPSIDRIEVTPLSAGEPLPYGTPVEVRVTGKDLWAPVSIEVLDVGAGTQVPELAHALPFDGSQPSLAETWPLRGRQLERVGTHPLRLVARYGELQREAELLSVLVTHTVDSVSILVRDRAGGLGPPAVPYPRLGDVAQLGVRISGTQLAGHPLTVNGGSPTVAPSDQLELMLVAPESDDFDDGKGREVYEFVVQSGGIERAASITLQRWGIEGCRWHAPEGRPYEEEERVNRNTQAVMRAELWGFPDTSGWFVFKWPRTEFTVWERDPGGRPTPEGIDFLKNNDDEGGSVDADVKGNASEASWTTRYDDEYDPLDLHANAAEYYFEVKVEDQTCTSGQILVY